MTCADVRARLFEPEAPTSAEVLAHLELCPSCARVARAGVALENALAPEPAELPAPPFAAVASAAARAARSARRRILIRRALPTAGFAAAAAVVAVLGTVAVHDRASPPPLLSPGDALAGADGMRTGRLASGATFELASGLVTLVRPAPGEERLQLTEGRVSVNVPKLAAGTALAVQTRDALVRVHGTRFSVALEPDGTRVAVSEGLVEVHPAGAGRPALLLHPGETVRVAPLEAYRLERRDRAAKALAAGDMEGAQHDLEALLGTEPPPIMSGEARAMLAWIERGRGRAVEAAALYQRALADLPAETSPVWAQDACAEWALLAEKSGSGASAWHECLRRFPAGAHAGLARQRLGEPR